MRKRAEPGWASIRTGCSSVRRIGRGCIVPASPKSRGLLCRDLLRANSARQAIDMAMEELTANKYDGVNFIIADYESGWAVHGGDDPHVVELIEGLNIISSYDLNDMRDERQKLARRLLTLQTLDSAVKFLAVAEQGVCPPAGRARSARHGRPRQGAGHGQLDADRPGQKAARRDLISTPTARPIRPATRTTRRCCATSSAAACVNRGRRRRRRAVLPDERRPD